MELSEKEIQELKEKKISIEELNDKYFYTQKDKVNIENILKLLNENICSFQKIVDKFKSIKDYPDTLCLYELLRNKKLFEELMQNNRLNTKNLEYLLNTIDTTSELNNLCRNTLLINFILNGFVLNRETVDKFNIMAENNDWFKDRNIHTIFDLIKYWNKNNEKTLKLNELNEKVYLLNSLDLNEDQKDELIEVLRNSEIAQNRLIQIVDNNLESNYDFGSLMNYLKKSEKKNIINI